MAVCFALTYERDRDSNLNCQRKINTLVNALRRQMRWMAFGSEGNPLQQLHPFRSFVHWYSTYQMNRVISPEVDARFEIHKNASDPNKTPPSVTRSKSVIDLALTAYLKQNPNIPTTGTIDPTFKSIAINQMKLFLFSGHDTTSSTVCYILYLLSTQPLALSHLRAEHDSILTPDASNAASIISHSPHLLNKLPYTTATIKESMRLFPAASTTRRGEPSFTITDPRNGLRYPASPDMLIWLVSHACQHDPAFWPRATEFLPERWLAKEGEELFPVPGAWRPFEHGPRACIGKELSMVELKIVLCLVARQFDFEAAYEEVDGREGGGGAVLRRVDGERAYQVGKGEPSGFLPCRVRRVVRS